MDTMGSAYEKQKDKSIRKSMGIFYTPDYIVDYILMYTVAEVDVVKNPFVKILDPTCGAGYFLIKAYNILKEKFITSLESLKGEYENYVYHIRGKEIKGISYWTEENIHYHIIKNCLYGADLDPLAVKITKKNLLNMCESKIKVDMNIVEGDSLIKWENLNNEVKARLYKSCSKVIEIDRKVNDLRRFWENQFDYIIGNPPYIVLLESEIEKDYWDYIKNNYKTIGYKKNMFYLIMERVLEKLKDGGKHSFIIPDRYFLTDSYEKSRKNLINNFKVLNITGFSDKIFEDAIVGTAIYIVEKSMWRDDYVIQLKLDYINECNFHSGNVRQKDVEKDKKFTINILTRYEFKDVIAKIKNNSEMLKEFCNVHVGMMIRNKNKHFNRYTGNSSAERIVLGRDLEEYIIDNDIRYFDINDIEIFGGTKNVKKHTCHPKILLRKTGNNLVAAIDENGCFVEQSVYLIIPCSNFKVYNLLGQIQSRLSNFYFKELLITNPKAYPYIQHYDVKKIPINLSLIYNEKYEKLIKNIIGIKVKIKSLKSSFMIDNKNYSEILHQYDEFKNQQTSLKLILKKNIEESNDILYAAYKLTEKEIRLIEREKDEAYIDNIYGYKTNSSLGLNKDCSSYYNELLYKASETLRFEVIKLLQESKKYLAIDDIEKGLKNRIRNFYDIIEIIRNYKCKKENLQILKELLNYYSDTWNIYIKNKSKKELIKYDKYEYGLSSWTSEIHKLWFLDNKKIP